MKGYAILLAVLLAGVLFTNAARLLLAGQTPLTQLLLILEPAAFAFCLAGALARAFHRTLFTPEIWRLTWTLTLALGVASIGFRAFGAYWGLGSEGVAVNALDLGMSALRFGLFAVPVMLYERELRGVDKI